MTGSHIELVVDPVACDGHGVCAELFPEHISTDPWGYPLVNPGSIPPSLIDHARRAVRWCPMQALHLVERNR
jgi:ferredoxin